MSIWSRISKIIASLISGEALSEIFSRLHTPPERTIGFTIAVIALSAKMARADGKVTQNEIRAFRQIFHIPNGEEKNAAHVFNLAQKDVAGFEFYAKQIAKMLQNNSKLLEDLIEGLLHISIADGSYHPNENQFITKVAEIFGLPETVLDTLKSKYLSGVKSNPYLVLGIDKEASYEEIRSHWKKLIQRNHPDNIVARGLPKEAVNLATTRLVAINAAWEEIKNNRFSDQKSKI